MRKMNKWLIIVPVITVMLLTGITAGVALAQDGPGQDIMARAAKILGIDQQKLQNAFTQASADAEAQRLAQLVKDGKITQAQADAWKKWQASKPAAGAAKEKIDAWMKARPDIPALAPPGMKGMPPGPPPSMDEMLAKLVKDGKITQAQADAWKKWQASKPDIPALERPFGPPKAK
jgi:hypothetical protein